MREWCLNASGAERFILGGGWYDSPYIFNDSYTQPPFDRSATNGIRLVRYLKADSSLARAAEPLRGQLRDLLHARVANDPVFAVYRELFDYDRTPLGARVIETIDEEAWTRELIRLNAAYAGDTLLVYLYLPRRGARPFPTVVFFPTGDAIRDPVPQKAETRHFDFLLRAAGQCCTQCTRALFSGTIPCRPTPRIRPHSTGITC